MSYVNATIGALVAGLALAATAASAQVGGVVAVTERVPYGDLDLKNPRGARSMLHRIQGATSRTCAQPNSPMLPKAHVAMHRCQGQTLARAVARLDESLVTQEYSRTRSAPPILEAER